jgi:hypothetical protein
MMAEKEYKAETYLIEYHCDECNIPIIQDKVGIRIEKDTPFFSHSCPECKRKYEFAEVKYPHTRVKYVREIE